MILYLSHSENMVYISHAMASFDDDDMEIID